MKPSRYLLVILAVISIVGFTRNQASEIPMGIIVMWSGDAGDLPDDWILCDGQHGSPDLRDKFIVGSGLVYDNGDMGGNVFLDLRHTHDISGLTGIDCHSHGPGTLATDTVAGHNHLINQGPDLVIDVDINRDGATANVANEVHWHGGTSSSGSHSHNIVTGTTSENCHSHGPGTLKTADALSAATDIRPPFYALCFIMYVGDSLPDSKVSLPVILSAR